MIGRISMIVSLACLGACSPAKDADADGAPDAEATPGAASASGSAAATAAQARNVSVKDGVIEFEYSYPAAAAAIPALKALLDADLDETQAKLRKGALEWREEAKKFPDAPDYVYSHTTAWKVVTDIPGWLSLSADRWEFTGGAHGNPWFDSLLWDKAANVRRKATDLFTSPAALSSAIRRSFCDQIDKQRAEKRGAPVDRNSGDMFDECIDPVESTVILGSSNGKTFDRVGVLVGPYAAGPYVEGDYEATIPVSNAVLQAARPEYRRFFSVKR